MNSIIHSSTTKFREFHRHHLRHRLHLRHGIGPSSPYYILWHYQILSPDSGIVAHWNHIFLVTCIIALFIDPLYFYLPLIGGQACLTTDTSLEVTVTIFRTLADLFYLLQMAMKFRQRSLRRTVGCSAAASSSWMRRRSRGSTCTPISSSTLPPHFRCRRQVPISFRDNVATII